MDYAFERLAEPGRDTDKGIEPNATKRTSSPDAPALLSAGGIRHRFARARFAFERHLVWPTPRKAHPREAATLCAESQAHYLSLHGRRAVAARHVRLQACPDKV